MVVDCSGYLSTNGIRALNAPWLNSFKANREIVRLNRTPGSFMDVPLLKAALKTNRCVHLILHCVVVPLTHSLF